jgi:hypothetical protein
MFGLAALGAKAQTVTGSGTPNKIPKFTGSSTIGDSVITENGGNVGIGITNPASPLQVVNTSNSSDQFGFGPYAIYASELSTINFTSAVRGDSLATTGGGNGVIGLTSSSGGAGVRGVSVEANGGGYGVIGSLAGNIGGGGGGVLGTTNSTTNFASAVRGGANGTSGGSVAIFGEQFSPEATTGLFINRAGGDILQGRVNQPDIGVFRVDGRGTVFANGGFRPFGADFAESVAVKGGSDQYFPGDLLVIDPSGERRLSLSRTPYSTLVAGIYSTQPGVVASTHRVDEALPNNEVPLAVVGIVPCKVTAENGPIVAGDLLVTSSTRAHAMKGTDRSRMLGAVVGKALEPLQKGSGVIQVLVTLQ